MDMNSYNHGAIHQKLESIQLASNLIPPIQLASNLIPPIQLASNLILPIQLASHLILFQIYRCHRTRPCHRQRTPRKMMLVCLHIFPEYNIQHYQLFSFS
jgi:hypothetical protein